MELLKHQKQKTCPQLLTHGLNRVSRQMGQEKSSRDSSGGGGGVVVADMVRINDQ
jgi:hypothetical protein